MLTTSFISKSARPLTVLVLSVVSAGVQAYGARGAEIDETCSAFNGAKPYAASGAFPNKCTLCHQDNRSIRHDPEWTWVQAGPDGQQNFCVVQGIIVNPAAASAPPDLEVSRGGTIALAARGFSPTKGAGGVKFAWRLSDRDAAVSGAKPDPVPMPNAGNVVVTLNVQDANGESDKTPEQRTVNVTTTPTVGNAESYAVQAGDSLTVAAPGVLANDTGTGKLSATLAANATQGALTLNPNGGFSYTPNVGYAGPDSFTYTASNGVLTSEPVVVGIAVNPAPPIATADRYSTPPGKALTIPAPGVLANDLGAGALSATLVTNVAQGELTLSPNGGFAYKPGAGFTGAASFAYKANNSAGASAPVAVTLNVGACTDKDKDGYSPEGAYCGPIDSDDRRASINPAVAEICGNGVDDDGNGLTDQDDPACGGLDCIGKLLAKRVNVASAKWNGKGGLLVAGVKAPAGATVNVSDAVSGVPLGSVAVKKSGSWKLALNGIAAAPCRVLVEINGASAQISVAGAPASCTVAASSQCGGAK
jgi:hypothetical protein